LQRLNQEHENQTKDIANSFSLREQRQQIWSLEVLTQQKKRQLEKDLEIKKEAMIAQKRAEIYQKYNSGLTS
jgi:hypothetical protein